MSDEPTSTSTDSDTSDSNDISDSNGTVRIVTDSSCDLPADVADALGIVIVPLSIRFGDEEFIDREQLTVAEFWTRCVASDTLPETAAPAPRAVRSGIPPARNGGSCRCRRRVAVRCTLRNDAERRTRRPHGC